MGEGLSDGVYRVAHLREAGWSRAQLDRADCPTEILGARRVGGLPDLNGRDRRIREAAVVMPSAGVVSGWAAAAVHGVPEDFADGTVDGRRVLPVDVSVPRDLGIYARRGIRLRFTAVPLEDVTAHDGIPVTSARRTALDLARWSRSEGRALAALDMCLRFDLISKGDFTAYLAPLKRLHGLRRTRTVSAEMSSLAESRPESELRWLWLSSDLPRPAPNVRVFDRFGQFVGRVDLLDVGSGLGAEYQGYWHRLDGAAELDQERFAKFEAMNLTIVPIWKQHMVDGSALSMLRQAHRRAEARDQKLDTWRTVPTPRVEPDFV